jgi:hypothetical protein
MATYQLAADPEGLGEGEGEGASPLWRAAYPHGEGEGEAETEAFFENLAEYAVGGGGGGGRGGGPGGGRAGLAGVGRAAAQAALSRAPVAGVPLGSLAISLADPGYVEGELELETQLGLGESESAAMVMEHFGHAATLAESEAEAEAFVIPLAALAAKALLPKVASFAARKALPFAMKKVLPRLTKGALQVTRQLRQNPATRPLVRTMPTIVQRTVADIARQVERGRPVTPELAARYLARETRRVLDDPHQCVHAYRRSRALDRRYHHACAQREM